MNPDVKGTPKKAVKKKGRKPKPESKDDCCRVCNVNFKIHYGISKCSTENLFKPSERKENKGEVLAEACERLGFPILKTEDSSDRVCRICSRKIRNAVENVNFLKLRLERKESQEVLREKRQLPTTVTPERKKSPPKVARGSCEQRRRGLFQDENVSDDVVSADDEARHLMNIDLSSFEEGKSKSHVRVIITYANGNVIVRQSFNETTESLLRNIATKEWSTVANIMFNHAELASFIPDVLRRKIILEFKSLCKDTILNGSSIEELIAFSNKLFLHEVSTYCPLWYSAMDGACGHTLRQSKKREATAVNAMALSTASLAKQRDPSKSALAYRISMLLFHSGIKYQDMRRLNRLGICMSPQSVIALQKQMGIGCDSKVLIWKRSQEDILLALSFIQEIRRHQVPVLGEDDMVIEVAVDVREETVSAYSKFSKATYELCMKLMNEAKERRGESVVTNTILDDVEYFLQKEKILKFRFVFYLHDNY